MGLALVCSAVLLSNCAYHYGMKKQKNDQDSLAGDLGREDSISKSLQDEQRSLEARKTTKLGELAGVQNQIRSINAQPSSPSANAELDRLRKREAVLNTEVRDLENKIRSINY